MINFLRGLAGSSPIMAETDLMWKLDFPCIGNNKCADPTSYDLSPKVPTHRISVKKETMWHDLDILNVKKTKKIH